MSPETAAIITVLLVGLGLILWLINHKLSRPAADPALYEWLKSTRLDLQNLQSQLSQSVETSGKNMTDTLQKSYQQLNQRLDQATQVIGELKTETGKFTEIGRSMKDLQDFLNSPKLRGNVGEQILTDLLNQVLPQQSFATQHRFRSGVTVDAIIKTQAGLIPIDSKFPMENYTRMNQAKTKADSEAIRKDFCNDVRRHIRTIAEKYINTDENTVDFALMYIPSETLYYEVNAIISELADYAQTKRVLFVSPSTFYAFLRTILVSFEGQRIQQQALVVLQHVRAIQKDADDFGTKLDVLNRHVTNAFNNMNTVSTDFKKLQGRITTTRQMSLDSDAHPQI